MEAESRQPKRQERATSALKVAIEALSLAEKTSSTAPAMPVFGLVTTIFLLTLVKVFFLPM